jgi:hypothetical protein
VLREIDPVPPTASPTVLSAPVVKLTEPLGPRTEVPVDMENPPLTPSNPEFAVPRVTLPLVDDSLCPASIDTEPPTKGSPVMPE